MKLTPVGVALDRKAHLERLLFATFIPIGDTANRHATTIVLLRFDLWLVMSTDFRKRSNDFVVERPVPVDFVTR